MISGVRLTQLANGESLLGVAWNYKNLTGIDAVEKRLEDLFNNAKSLGFNYVIDSITPRLNPDGTLYLYDNGIYGDKWPMSRRLELYQKFSFKNDIQIYIELNFPTSITEDNYKIYASYFTDELLPKYPWICYWQILTLPESNDDEGNVKCSPELYVKLLKEIYTKTKETFQGVKIGGPGIYQALIDYANSQKYVNKVLTHTGWLSEAIGEKYGTNKKYDSIGKLGFLEYIDFFSFEGRQDTNDLRYEIFTSVIDKLNIGLNVQFSKYSINNNLKLFSTFQGHKANKKSSIDLQLQAYNDLREILNCSKENIIPFKNQLVDEFFATDDEIDTTKSDFGLYYYYLGSNGSKPSCEEYKFILQNLKNYNYVAPEKYSNQNYKYFEYNQDLDNVVLINKEQTELAIVIWPKSPRALSPTSSTTYKKVTLNSHYNRKYLTPTSEASSIIDPVDIVFKNYDFVIIYETIKKVTVDTKKIENYVNKKVSYNELITKQLLNLLSSEYNKETIDTGFYKLLRALALEMSDVQIQMDRLKENMYIDTAHQEDDYAIYNNFGVLVKLQKKITWDEEKYRNLVKGVIKSLLKGPTLESVSEAVKLFTNFDVNIYECYKDDSIDPMILQGINRQFAFVVEIEKPIDSSGTQDSIYEDAAYVLNIVKPAHTLPIVIVILIGTENYRDYYKQRYGIDFSQGDTSIVELEENAQEGIYGWKYSDYPGIVSTVDTNVYSNKAITNGGMLIGPRYVLYDESNWYYEDTEKEKYKGAIEDLLFLLEVPESDTYKGAEDRREWYYEQLFREEKYGILYDDTIETNGGLLYKDFLTKTDIIGTKGKILNKYRLGYTTRLSEKRHIDFDVLEKDKYKQVEEKRHIDFDVLEKDKYSGAKEERHIDFIEFLKEMKFGVVDNNTIKTDGGNLNGKYKEFRTLNKYKYGYFYRLFDILSIDFESFNKEKFKQPIEEKSIYINNFLSEKTNGYKENYDILLEYNEFYRQRKVSENNYHVHKMIIRKVVDKNNKIFLPERDLYKISNDLNNLEIYINGILLSNSYYIQHPYYYDKDYSNVIILNENIFNIGDTIIIKYLVSKSIIVSDFPVKDYSKFHLENINNVKVDFNKYEVEKSFLRLYGGNSRNYTPSRLNISKLYTNTQEVFSMEMYKFDNNGKKIILKSTFATVK